MRRALRGRGRRYLLPDDAPLPEARNLQALWDKYTPDRFDQFSVGE